MSLTLVAAMAWRNMTMNGVKDENRRTLNRN